MKPKASENKEAIEPIANMTEIETVSSKNGWDLICPGCGKPVKALLNRVGKPAVCSACHRAELAEESIDG